MNKEFFGAIQSYKDKEVVVYTTSPEMASINGTCKWIENGTIAIENASGLYALNIDNVMGVRSYHS